MNDSEKKDLTPNNSWEYIEALRSYITKNKGEGYISLEDSWAVLSDESSGVFERNEQSASTPLDDFLYSLDLGFYPRPEILLFLANSFELYFLMKGELSLEDIFFGKPKRSIGIKQLRKPNKKLYSY